jgi:hypothetical protein
MPQKSIEILVFKYSIKPYLSFNIFFMKKLSLFSLLVLMLFISVPIYAEENDVYVGENYVVVAENVNTEEIGNEIEENDVVLAVEEEPTIG